MRTTYPKSYVCKGPSRDWLKIVSWLEHQPVTLGVVGSSPIRVATSGAKASTYFETCFQGII